MKLEELVPPLELCKLIPKGEFEDSCFAWSYPSDKRKTEPFVDYRKYIEFCRRNIVNSPDVCPAPTLEEITKELGHFIVSCFDSGYSIEITTGWDCVSADSAVEGAMKLWLELKGIDV
jgi:hypothetical protein